MSIKETGIENLSGISTKRSAMYKKLGVLTVWDLITYYPRGYIDYTKTIRIGETDIGQYAVLRLKVEKKLKPIISTYSHINVFKLILSDGENEILCIFFNNPYTFEKLFPGKEYLFYGKIGGTVLLRELLNPQFIELDSENRLVPRYRLTSGLSHVMIANTLRLALPLYDLPDNLPEYIKEEFKLIDKKSALYQIHFPVDNDECTAAKKRLAFDELITLQLGMAKLKNRNRKLTGALMKEQSMDEFYWTLPFEPTGAQKRAVNDAIADMSRPVPMNRLLQGDVGSGKTMVAAGICFFAYKNGYQSVMMAPTEILAKQHYQTLRKFLEPIGVRVALLTGSLTASEKKTVKEQIKSGEVSVIVGTQALIQKNVAFEKLGLVVTDEQHRFGVNQRGTLISKGENPHTLVMSATPIPRTLALIIYGDLDISLIDEMPKGRIPIETYSVDTSFRERLYKFIIKHVNMGLQAYIVCPMIDDSVSEKTSAVRYYNELKATWFKGIKIGLLHGKMKQAEKDAVMGAFKEGEISVLISTTVIEVGVDVPNSVIMLIENAEQFGLSQLHQLRGRVGRGTEKSYCILVTNSKTPYTAARMETMTRTANGFEIANEDLKLRGPGDFFGQKQHGLPELKIADMTEDIEIVEETRLLAERIIIDDPELIKPQNTGLSAMIGELFKEGDNFGNSFN